MDTYHLSKRLAKAAAYVPQGARLADIGSDHAYLPANLAINHIIDYGVAGEVVKGPYENAVHEIQREHLEEKIFPRFADGLKAIEDDDQIDTITICGMGGTLIRNILEKDKSKLQNHPLLILQPNVGSNVLRQWLQANHYQIMHEDILEEDDHIYEIIVAKYASQPMRLSSEDLFFGPILRHHQNDAFTKKWEKEIEKNKKAISQMQKATNPPTQRLAQLKNENELIKEVLANGKS
ncbi:tRNA (adenine(22)-N(1))-methyltransferase [Ligilactobacillus araffinosus]|uniref:SAM-dependent methyltransferase n=1 Tax=Ligilactobacillus araffinosus DSM 20653 TaxID=1423820 RepID=A0A0R1ZCM9_9LACO|nr:tRNA (adenine(22)-N(1))-methyltransferase TrmK [Ligilactobacillus araffinosus]KRM52098.1 SAM-dependent methyltransferase [Ligilactobacillus araffinosus DSM 20653]